MFANTREYGCIFSIITFFLKDVSVRLLDLGYPGAFSQGEIFGGSRRSKVHLVGTMGEFFKRRKKSDIITTTYIYIIWMWRDSYHVTGAASIGLDIFTFSIPPSFIMSNISQAR